MSTASGTLTSPDLESAASETFSKEETETREIELFAIALVYNKMYLFKEYVYFLAIFFPSLSSLITFNSLLNDLIHQGTSAYF